MRPPRVEHLTGPDDGADREVGAGGHHDLAGAPATVGGGDLDRLVLGVQPEQERAVPLLLATRAGGAERVAGDEHADDAQCVVRPVVARHLSAARVEPDQVLGSAVDRRSALEPVPLSQRRVLTTQPERRLGHLVDVEPRVVGTPVDPRDLVVLHVGVVVAALGPSALVTGRDHRDAGGQAERHHQVRGDATPQGDDLRVVRLALDPEVLGAVVVAPVAVVLAVGAVVLAHVGDRVAHREAVMGGHEVHRGVRRAPVVGVQVGGAGQPRRDGPDARGVTPPEVPDRVAVLVVPLHPRRWELADAVAVHRHVPRLGDQLHVTQRRVLPDRGEQVGAHVDVVADPGQCRHQVEPEAVDPHLLGPVAQGVEDQPQREGVRGIHRVAAAGHVPVRVVVGIARRRVVDPVVEPAVVEAAERQRRAVDATLGGVVVDHVEDHLETRGVERPHHLLELAHLLAAVTRRRVGVVRREEADRVVAPVVLQAARHHLAAR